MDQYSTLSLDMLRWRASDMVRVVDQGLPPRSLEVVGVGFAAVGQSGDPVLDYLLKLQSSVAESGFGLSVRWDGVQNAVFVDEAYVDFFAGNRIEATARIDGVNLTDQTTMQTNIGSMGLKDLVVTTQFSGWFETFVAVPMGSALLDSDGVAPETKCRICSPKRLKSLTICRTASFLPRAVKHLERSFKAYLHHVARHGYSSVPTHHLVLPA